MSYDKKQERVCVRVYVYMCVEVCVSYKMVSLQMQLQTAVSAYLGLVSEV